MQEVAVQHQANEGELLGLGYVRCICLFINFDLT